MPVNKSAPQKHTKSGLLMLTNIGELVALKSMDL